MRFRVGKKFDGSMETACPYDAIQKAAELSKDNGTAYIWLKCSRMWLIVANAENGRVWNGRYAQIVPVDAYHISDLKLHNARQ